MILMRRASRATKRMDLEEWARIDDQAYRASQTGKLEYPERYFFNLYASAKIKEALENVHEKSQYFPSLINRIEDAKKVMRQEDPDWKDNMSSAIYRIEETVEKHLTSEGRSVSADGKYF